MKPLIFAALLLLTVAALAFWGDRMAGAALDEKLAPLLSKQLGLPVQLAPVQARLLRLQVRSPTLIMGDPDNPAVTATDVAVRLAWADLLRGEIRLVGASATDLMVRPSSWPSSDSPAPTDYLFLDQWLPRNLSFDTGHYVTAADNRYPLQNFKWRRKLGGSATLTWSEERSAGDVAINATVTSLNDLLRLSPIALKIALNAPPKENSTIDLQVSIGPGETSGYKLEAQVSAADTTANIRASNAVSWHLPDHSDTTIKQLDMKKLRALVTNYQGPSEKADTTTLLASTLPSLSLPEHQGRLAIDEIQIDNEWVKDNSVEFTTSSDGLAVSKLTLTGPAAILQGQFAIASSPAGWQVNLEADVEEREADQSIGAQYLSADWIWRSGHTKLHGKGTTWSTLLNSLNGEATIAGVHRRKTETPFKLVARLDNKPGEFVLDQIDIQLGDGQIKGSAALTNSRPRKLSINATGEKLDVAFLFTNEEAQNVPGTPIPEYLEVLPGIDLDFDLAVTGLQIPGMSLAKADVTLQRTPDTGFVKLVAEGLTGGELELQLVANEIADPSGTDVTLHADLTKLDIPQFFQQQVLFQSRSSGTVDFEGKGDGLEEIFKSMRGTAKLEVDYRRDSNWARASANEEQLSFSGAAEFVIEKKRILGLQLSDLDIESFKQDITGKMSIVSARTPWMVANLQSEKLDIDGLLDLIPESSEAADQVDLLTTLKSLGSMRFSIEAEKLTLLDQPMSNLALVVSSETDSFTIKQLDLTAEDSKFKSSGNVSWKDDRAAFTAAVNVTDFDLDRFLFESPSITHVPVSGSISLKSEGVKFSQLLANLSGQVNLKASNTQSNASTETRRNLVMDVMRVTDGATADIDTFEWGENTLSGKLRYYKSSPPLLELDISDGSLSLLPWQASDAAADKKKQPKDGDLSKVEQAAGTSASFVGKLLVSPFNFLAGSDDSKPSEKYFSDTPLPFDALKSTNANIKGHLSSITSSAGVVKDLNISATLKNGELAGKASAGAINGGTGEIDIALNTNVTPATAQVTSTFQNLNGLTERNTFPRSGYIALTSQGESTAALAGNLNGTVYLKLGKGPFDYENVTLLSAGLASTMFRTLIPGIEKRRPEMECGVTLATFKDGSGITPYGYAARTTSANLMGRIVVDLKTERIKMAFESRSREGLGISLGNVFSNTVRIKGPLTDPEVVPDAGSIIWRGAAAYMTLGLSVLGENALKRALASGNPCKEIQEHITKDICGTQQPAASSALVCPPA